jgi:hypothetical protein
MSQQYPQDENSQPQYPGGGAPTVPGPPPGWTPPPAPKKPFFKRTGVIVTAAVIGLLVVIGVANSGNGGDGPAASNVVGSSPTVVPTSKAPKAPQASTTPSQKAPATKQAPKTTQPPADTTCTGNRNDPCQVKLGVAFTVGKHKLEKGWKLKNEEYTGTKLVGTVTNVSEDTSTAFFNVKFLKGSKVVANFQCSSSELEPGQNEDVECINMSDTGSTIKSSSYKTITAEATF